jgi:hypothetical protein
MASKKAAKENDADPMIKKQVLAYKYSKKGQDSLYEAILLCGEPCFVMWDLGSDKGFKIVPVIEESTRIIRPPNPEEYPYTPYEFTDEKELREYFRKANTTTIDQLYQTVKSFFQKYVDQDENIKTVLAADSILTYFQDLFPIIHYSEGVGGNDVGKSSIGYTFEYARYRVIRGTSISGANYFRILGPVEPGQCTIIEDEGDSISEDPDKVRILKAGYEYSQKIPKTNMNTQRQEQNWFYPFCYKMILAEKSLSEWKAKGLVDRTFTFKCRPGKVRYSIKKVVSQTINKSPQLEKLYYDLLDFRKLIICYRLIHYTDDLPQIKVSLINRDEELTYPLLQLFYGTEAFEELKTALEFFIKQRKERRQRSLEAALYPIIKDLVTINTDLTSNIVNIPYSKIWEKITTGGIKGNKYSDTQYETQEYGPLYHNTLSKLIGDKFSGNLRHKEEGSILTLDRPKFESYDDIYNHQTEGSDIVITVTLIDPEGTEGMTALPDGFDNNENEKKETNAPPGAVRALRPSAFPPKCYHCDFSNYETKQDYESHCVLRHPGKPAYPGPADIQESNLTPQGMCWEESIPRG